jgi:hypothetical protein
MKHIKQIFMIGVISYFSFFNLILAQEGNFTGTWSLNKEKSRVPNFPNVKIEILQNGNTLHYKETAGSIVYQMTLTIDGIENEYTSVRGNKLKCSAQLEDRKLMIFSIREAFRNGKLVLREVKQEFNLSDDGKSLQLIRVDIIRKLNERQEWNLYFDKL